MWAWIITSYITDSNKRHLYWHPHIYSSFPTAHCVLKHTPPNAMPVLHTPLWGTSALVSECQGHVSEPFRPGPKVWHNEICERPECQILTDSDTQGSGLRRSSARDTHHLETSPSKTSRLAAQKTRPLTVGFGRMAGGERSGDSHAESVSGAKLARPREEHIPATVTDNWILI